MRKKQPSQHAYARHVRGQFGSLWWTSRDTIEEVTTTSSMDPVGVVLRELASFRLSLDSKD